MDLFARREAPRTGSLHTEGKEPGMKALEALSQGPVVELFHMLIYFKALLL